MNIKKHSGYLPIFRYSLFSKIGVGFIFLFLFGMASCGGSKKVAEENIYHKRKPFKAIFHEANSERMIGHYENAILLFEKCLTIETENPTVHFALSDLYERQGNKTKTLSYAKRAYELNSSNKWYVLRLADLYYNLEEYSKTADLYAKIIDEEKNINLKFKYVDALLKSTQYEKAIVMLDEIEVETGKTPEISFTKADLYTILNKKEEANRELEEFLADNPVNSDYKIMAAEYYMQNNNFPSAKEIVNSILKDDPDYGQAHLMMADLELRQNNVTAAFENLEKGFLSDMVDMERKLEILHGLIPYTSKNERDYKEMRQGVNQLFEIIYDPELNNPKLHDYYGFYLVTLENYDEAEKEYQLTCDLDASSFNNWLQLLNLNNQLSHFMGMKENGIKAIDVFPAQPILYLFTGIGAKETKEYEAAEEWFFIGKDLVVQDPQLRSEFLYQLGDLNYRQDKPDDGAFYFKQAIEIFDGNINVYADRATRLMEEGKLDQAETEIKKGVAITPKNAKLLHVYGLVLFEKKAYKEAADQFLKALYDNYYNGLILEHYGDAIYFTGEKDKAFELWKEAIKYGNTSEVLKRKVEDKKYYAPH